MEKNARAQRAGLHTFLLFGKHANEGEFTLGYGSEKVKWTQD